MNRFDELKEILEFYYDKFNQPEFIENDPVYVPHLFSDYRDIEIAGFFSAILAWGNRKTIVASACRLMNLMDNQPFNFIINAGNDDMASLKHFVHRTFNGSDALFFAGRLRSFYFKYASMKYFFENLSAQGFSVGQMLVAFRNEIINGARTHHPSKHIADVNKNAAAKRLNMFFRWMVRNDGRGVDIGIWSGIPAAKLMIPLDIHTGNVARKLGLLQNKTNNWKAVEELTSILRLFDAEDPVKYDFALFGLGIFEKIK